MGQIKKQRKKYKTPSHPWQAERLKEESSYVANYGFRNKKEIWKVIAKIENYKGQVKKIIAKKNSTQMKKEKENLISKLLKYGLLKKDSKFEEILELSPSDLMDRRLQTVVYKKGMARSLKQARQFIVHGHILVSNKKLTVPSYLVNLEEESKISLSQLIPAVVEKKEDSKIKEITKEKEVIEKKEDIKKELKGEVIPTASELKEKKEESNKVEA